MGSWWKQIQWFIFDGVGTNSLGYSHSEIDKRIKQVVNAGNIHFKFNRWNIIGGKLIELIHGRKC